MKPGNIKKDPFRSSLFSLHLALLLPVSATVIAYKLVEAKKNLIFQQIYAHNQNKEIKKGPFTITAFEWKMCIELYCQALYYWG